MSGSGQTSRPLIRNARAGAMSDNETYLAQRERIYEGMRAAGVPEG